MDDIFKNVGIIILAAGQGKRLGCTDKPKVLFEIGGKPIIKYILETLEQGRVLKNQICLVVNFQASKVKKECGENYLYAFQKECKGTAHAVQTGESVLPDYVNDLLALNGDDSAFYTFKTLRNFVSEHKNNNCDISLLTCEPEDPSDLGRIVRDKNGKVVKIVEKENLEEEHKNLKEASTGTFCFKRIWFNKYINKIKPIKNLGEFGLPSMVDLALKEKANFQTLKLEDPDEWFGINTKEQLEEAGRRKGG
ncbi:MAG: sugar phosphate nucleotidyltransferase [Patescibacteria group bacterium]